MLNKVTMLNKVFKKEEKIKYGDYDNKFLNLYTNNSFRMIATTSKLYILFLV